MIWPKPSGVGGKAAMIAKPGDITEACQPPERSALGNGTAIYPWSAE